MKKLFFLFIILPHICFAGQLWTKTSSPPVLQYTPAGWDASYIGEPFVLNISGSWYMFYTGASAGIGRATSSDGITWTKYGTTAVIGSNLGESNAAHFGMWYTGTTLYCYFNDGNNDLQRMESTDLGITWTNRISAISESGQAPANVTKFVTSSIVQVGSTYHMLVECGMSTGQNWAIFHWTSTDLTNWTVQNSGLPLLTLQKVSGGEFGGPNLHYINGIWYIWYHAQDTGGGVDNLHFASSPDLGDDWTQIGDILQPIGNEKNLPSVNGHNANSTGDGRVIEVSGQSYFYYNRSWGTSPYASDITVATFNGTLAQLISLINTVSYGQNVTLNKASLN